MTPEEHLAREAQPDDVVRLTREEDCFALFYLCPACDGSHAVSVFGTKNHCGASWDWNGDYQHPTISPSIKATAPGGYCCHHFVRDGRMEVCGDSSKNAGRTLPMAPLSDG
ncbi:MAG TPA: DUF6527 family protein [Bacteroidia bacterium]|nr:DUF6527 family protein [Bacteroidia bacterium]